MDIKFQRDVGSHLDEGFYTYQLVCLETGAYCMSLFCYILPVLIILVLYDNIHILAICCRGQVMFDLFLCRCVISCVLGYTQYMRREATPGVVGVPAWKKPVRTKCSNVTLLLLYCFPFNGPIFQGNQVSCTSLLRTFSILGMGRTMFSL